MYRKGNHDDKDSRPEIQEDKKASQPGDDRGINLRSRTPWEHGRDLQTRGDCPDVIFSVAIEGQGGCCPGPWASEATRQDRAGPGKGRSTEPAGKTEGDGLRPRHRTSAPEKKRALGLHGSLIGKHLPFKTRKSFLAIIDETLGSGEALTHCRRLAYELERRGKAYVGKTKAAEIMKQHGLNHAFERSHRPPMREPADTLAYEPRAKNLVWGMDWTWVNVDDRFMFLLVLLDW